MSIYHKYDHKCSCSECCWNERKIAEAIRDEEKSRGGDPRRYDWAKEALRSSATVNSR